MRRFMPLVLLPAVLVALAIGVGQDLRAEDEDPTGEDPKTANFEDLDKGTQKEIGERARQYFDPQVEFLWRPRRDFVAALKDLEDSSGVNALKDLPFLRQIVYQGRHFLPPFDDRKWREAHLVEAKKKGIFQNLKSEEWRFTYTIPKGYPDKRGLSSIPRKGRPHPLLVSLIEDEDTRNSRDQAEEFPGMAVLTRRFPKGDFGALYDNWLTLAPVAARARFLEDDNSIRHLFLTAVITEFWRHYHVDFDKIVIDGTEAAAALAAVFPNIFAGLVLRGGEIEPDLVKNFASVPVFVVKNSKTTDLAEALEGAGHEDVTTGTRKDVVVWLNQRKRTVPASFEWKMTRDDHRYANWITLLSGAPQRNLKVETDRASNKITVTATGIESFQMFLNDEVVDLDNEVTVVVNGHELKFRETRNFGQVFDKDPYVRRNMTFGWLYPVMIEKIKVPEKKAGEETPATTDDPTPPEETGPKGTPEDEAKAKKWFDRGQAAEADGDLVKARTWYRKAVAVGETSYKARAQERLDALDEPGGGDAEEGD